MRYGKREDFEKANIFGTGAPNTAYAKYFIGDSFLAPLGAETDCPLGMANVTFAPGCRNNWHVHTAARGGGQVLLCVAGEGWYQEEGKAPVSLAPGSVVNIAPGVKHWHGAKRDSWFSHIAISTPGDGCATEWLEPVADSDYDALE